MSGDSFQSTFDLASSAARAPARADSDDGYVAKGGTGFGVRTLVETVLEFAEPD